MVTVQGDSGDVSLLVHGVFLVIVAVVVKQKYFFLWQACHCGLSISLTPEIEFTKNIIQSRIIALVIFCIHFSRVQLIFRRAKRSQHASSQNGAFSHGFGRHFYLNTSKHLIHQKEIFNYARTWADKNDYDNEKNHLSHHASSYFIYLTQESWDRYKINNDNKHFESSQKLLKSNICKYSLKEYFWAANFSTWDKPLSKNLKSVL